MKKLVLSFFIVAAFTFPIFAKDFNQQRIFSAFTHSSYYMLSADEQQAWKELCKQANLPSKIQLEEGIIKDEIGLVEYTYDYQRILYAALLVGYIMGKYKDFIVNEWR